MEKEKVYCSDCKSFTIDRLCKFYLNRCGVYLSCEFANKNNDCKDFKQKRSWKYLWLK